MKFVICLLLLIAVCSHLEASNILALWPVLSLSRFNVALTLVEKLAEKGHSITLISPYEPKDTKSNITFIKLENVANTVDVVKFFEMRNYTTYEMISYKIDFARDKVDFALRDESMKKFLKSGQQFDVMILDNYQNDALLGIAYYLKLPVITFSTAGSSLWSDKMVGNPLNPSYNPNMALGFAENMNFCERLKNTWVTIVETFAYYFHYIPSQEALLIEYFKELIPEPMPRLFDLIQNVNLVLLNTHPLVEIPKAHVPNSIEVGGMHIRTIDEEIQPEFVRLMDRTEKGIIYFSLGANTRSADLPLEKLDIFLNVFATMEQVLVLWKFETIALKERHINSVVIGPWLPQQEILQNKNIKAFITHGGPLSLMEAVYYGKPVIGIPLLNDQKANMAKAVSQGYGVSLDYETLSEESFKGALDAVFNITSYRENAERLSAIFKDNPIEPIDKTIHYIEHVIRTNGAAHLKTSATKLSFLQIHLVDQVAFVLSPIALFLIAIFVLSKGMKWLKTKFQKRGESGTIKSSNKKKVKSN